MNYSTVLMTSDRERAAENKIKFLAIYRQIEAEHPELYRRCRKLRIRARKAYERLTYKPSTGYVTDSYDDSYYDWLDEINEREHAEMDGAFPLGNETDAEFANRFFDMEEIARLQCGLFDEVAAEACEGADRADAPLIRRAFLLELRGDSKAALEEYLKIATADKIAELILKRSNKCRERIEEENK